MSERIEQLLVKQIDYLQHLSQALLGRRTRRIKEVVVALKILQGASIILKVFQMKILKTTHFKTRFQLLLYIYPRY